MTRLYRSNRDKRIAGICGGLAEVLNVDATLLRLMLVIIAVISGGTVIVIYLIASLVIPKASAASYAGFQDYHSHVHRSDSSYDWNKYQEKNTSAKFQSHRNGTTEKSDLDEMMRDVETKAMKREIDELRAKLNKYEKGEQ